MDAHETMRECALEIYQRQLFYTLRVHFGKKISPQQCVFFQNSLSQSVLSSRALWDFYGRSFPILREFGKCENLRKLKMDRRVQIRQVARDLSQLS
jgi:hypothetical protein